MCNTTYTLVLTFITAAHQILVHLLTVGALINFLIGISALAILEHVCQ